MIDNTHVGQNFYGQIYVTGIANVINVGTPINADLIVIFPYVQSSVATEINLILGINGGVSNDSIGNVFDNAYTAFQGVFNWQTGSYGHVATNVRGQMAGCVYRNDLGGPTPSPTANYECYKVLLVQ